MSSDSSSSRGAPTNAELAERMARVEQDVSHVSETVDRIEERVTDDHDDLAEQVEENTERTASLWAAYRLGKWGLPVVGTLLGAAAAAGAI